MKKNKALGYVLLAIIFVALSVVVFVIPTVKTSTFLIAYIFTIVAFLIQIFIWKIAFGRDTTLKSKFLGFPLIHVGIVYLVVQIVALIVFTVLSGLPVWSGIIVCVIILAVAAVCMISVEAATDEIKRVDNKVAEKVAYIKNLQLEVELMANSEDNEEVKYALQELAEKLRFSDPMSNEQLAECESRIADKISNIKTSANKMQTISEAEALLSERNKKCKAMK